MELKHLSASGVHLFTQCPAAFFAKYRDNLVTDQTNDSYANYGTLVHTILENIANGDKYAFIDNAIEHFEKEFPHCGLTKEQEEIYYPQGINTIAFYWEELQTLDIVQAEANFKFKRKDDEPPLVGFIDLVYKDEKGRYIVRDYKTSKKYTKAQMGKQWQPYFYSIACKKLYGEYPYKFEFCFVRFGQTNSILIDENFLKMYELMLDGIISKIKKEITKAVYNPFYCSNFCSCRSICPMYNSKKG